MIIVLSLVMLFSYLLFTVARKIITEDLGDLPYSMYESKFIDVENLKKAKKFGELFAIKDSIIFKNQVIGSVNQFIKLPNGNYLISDGITREIYIFNSKGEFLRRLGNKGSGPGEFLYPIDVKFNDKDGLIYVLDIKLSRVSAYDTTGKYQFSFNIRRRGEHMILVSERLYVYGAGYIQEDMVSCFNSKNGKLLFTFCEPSDFIKSIKMPISGKVGGCVLYKNRIFLIHPYEYVIRIFNLSGEKLKDIKVNSSLYRYPKLTPDSFIDISTFTPILSPVLNLGDIFFIIIQIPDEQKTKNYLEIFYLPEEKVLTSFNLDGMYPLFIDREGYVYFSYQPLGDKPYELPNPVIYICEFIPLKVKR